MKTLVLARSVSSIAPAVRSSSTRNPIHTARRATFTIVLEAVGPHVASSRGLISDVCGGAQYQDKVSFETVKAKVWPSMPRPARSSGRIR